MNLDFNLKVTGSHGGVQVREDGMVRFAIYTDHSVYLLENTL